MSNSDGFLKMALVAGAVLVVLAGGLYLSTMTISEAEPPPKARLAADRAVHSARGQQPVLNGIPAQAIARMTKPRVTPSTDLEVVERVLTAAVPSFAGCYDEHAGQDGDMDGTAYVRFLVGAQGQVIDLGVLLHGIVNVELQDCIGAAAGSQRFEGASEDTLVAWPLRYRGADGLQLR